jgi:N-methylhydantoinase A
MTAVLNAYVQAAAGGYLDRLSAQLTSAGVHVPLQVMQSNGGTVPADQARAVPIALVESGPVAGVIGAAAVGRASGRPDIISLDIGGTTAKLSLVEGGNVRVTTDYRIDARRDYAGYPIRTPIVDIVEIGAGGGSIVWLDEVGRMAVGPQSAGARPGPACYPEGGSAPTITDANVITGRLDAAGFLGGRMPLSVERARMAFAPIAETVGVSIEEAARGSLRIAQGAMANALKLISVHRGHDPRRFSLVAMGGGGPLHAAELAAELQIETVIVPPLPALFSAWGMLTCDGRRDWVRTRVVSSNAPDATSVVAGVWEELENVATRAFDHDGGGGRLLLQRYVDARYAGQEHTVKVRADELEVDANWVNRTCRAFEREHLQQYGFRLDDEVAFVNFHLTGTTPSTVPTRVEAMVDPPHADAGASRVVDFDSLGARECCVRHRATLACGDEIGGPALIEEPTATTLLRPGDRARIDAAGNIVIGVAT